MNSQPKWLAGTQCEWVLTVGFEFLNFRRDGLFGDVLILSDLNMEDKSSDSRVSKATPIE